MKENGFFVNLKSESSESLAYKIGLIVSELESRTKKNKNIGFAKHNHAIDKPTKRPLSKEEVENKIKKWSREKDLKVSKCLLVMKEHNWTLDAQQWKKTMGDLLLINNPTLFLVSLTKKPYERKWINSNGVQKKASDYGNVLVVEDNCVKLNTDYEQLIKMLW